MSDYSIVPNTDDVNEFFRLHPELVTELTLIALKRIHSALLDQNGAELGNDDSPNMKATTIAEA